MRPLPDTECLHCGTWFQPNKRGHIFCSPLCRHRGPREQHERSPIDEAQITRLFDESRDPSSDVRDDDWHPTPDLGFFELDAGDTLMKRRRWYGELREEGRL